MQKVAASLGVAAGSFVVSARYLVLLVCSGRMPSGVAPNVWENLKEADYRLRQTQVS